MLSQFSTCISAGKSLTFKLRVAFLFHERFDFLGTQHLAPTAITPIRLEYPDFLRTWHIGLAIGVVVELSIANAQGTAIDLATNSALVADVT